VGADVCSKPDDVALAVGLVVAGEPTAGGSLKGKL
jgi:hypothetical protein